MLTTARRDLALSAGIVVACFGGIPVAIALENAGLIADAGSFGWGCVIGSLLLAYLAYLKPRRDIVSLCVPLFALFIFILPASVQPTLLTQVLYAASVTVLVVRLNRSFSKKQGDARPAVPLSESD